MQRKELSTILTINLVSTLKTAVLFCVIVGFGGILNIFFTRGVDVLTLSLIFALMWANRAYTMSLKLLLTIIGFIAITLIVMFATGSPITEYFSFWGRFIAMALLITAFKNDYNDIKEHLIKVIKIVIVLAGVNFVLTSLVPGLFSLKTTANGFPVNTIGYIFNFHSKIDVPGLTLYRNQGVFWEPGVLQIPTNIYIYYKLIEQNKSLKSVIFPIIILFTTVSTTGFLILASTLFFKFKSIFTFKGKGLWRTLGLTIVIAAFIPFLYMMVYNKFNKPGEKVSSMARTYDLMMAANIAIKNPLFGIGVNPARQQAEMKSITIDVDGYSPESRGNTNSILQLFVNFGFPLSIFIIIAIYRQRLFKYRLPFFTLIMLSLFSEPLVGVFLLMLIPLSSIKLPLLKDEE